VRRRFWILPLMLVIVGMALLSACSDDDAESSDGDVATRLQVTASDFAFEPSELRLKAGQRYELVLENEGQQLHEWTIDAIPATEVSVGASGEHAMGETNSSGAGGEMMTLHIAAERAMSANITFMPIEPGEYVFYCTVPGHRESGMEGRLVVEQ